MGQVPESKEEGGKEGATWVGVEGVSVILV